MDISGEPTWSAGPRAPALPAGPTTRAREAGSRRLSLTKALTWRAVAMLITGTVAYVLTGSASFALGVGAIDSMIKVVAYYLHERAWMKLALAGQASELAK